MIAASPGERPTDGMLHGERPEHDPLARAYTSPSAAPTMDIVEALIGAGAGCWRSLVFGLRGTPGTVC